MLLQAIAMVYYNLDLSADILLALLSSFRATAEPPTQ